MISESILVAERVRLRPVQESDLPHFQRWLADDELRRWMGGMPEQPTVDEEYEWYFRRREDPDSVLWAIETAEGELIGSTELRLSPENHRGEVGIALFDRAQWGKGYGTEAMRLVLEYAFEELELNRVELTTDEDNARAIHSYEKCGFVREGVLRAHRVIDGRPSNSLMMAIVREDWQAQ